MCVCVCVCVCLYTCKCGYPDTQYTCIYSMYVCVCVCVYMQVRLPGHAAALNQSQPLAAIRQALATVADVPVESVAVLSVTEVPLTIECVLLR
jgi:hypothetical protein